MCDRRVDRNHKIERAHCRGGFGEVAEARSEIDDMPREGTFV